MAPKSPAAESFKIEQRAQRQAARRSEPDAELSEALEGTFPASDPVSVQAPVTAGGSVLEEHFAWVGDEAEELADMAGERMTELQELLVDEIRARPLRAIAWAAAAGVVLGFWAAR